MDVETVRSLVAYDPTSGKFYWKHRDTSLFKTKGSADYWNKMYASKECFCTRDAQGYNVGSIRDKQMYAHRVAWAITHGEWPDGLIDHINGERTDNRFKNLRCVTKAENGRNQGLKSTNTSGVQGVMWHKKVKRWTAEIKFNNQRIRLGTFKDFDQAVAARKAAEIVLGFHPNHGARPARPILDYQRGRRHD